MGVANVFLTDACQFRMATSRSRVPAEAPNRYDGLAGIVALAILAWAFLYAI